MSTMVWMYTIYNDLTMPITSSADYERVKNIQKPRDAILRRAMVAANIPDFPLPLEQAITVNPFFQEKTTRNRSLNILLIHKNGTNEVSYVVISHGNINTFPTREAALNSITNITDVNATYELASYKIDP